MSTRSKTFQKWQTLSLNTIWSLNTVSFIIYSQSLLCHFSLKLSLLYWMFMLRSLSSICCDYTDINMYFKHTSHYMAAPCHKTQTHTHTHTHTTIWNPNPPKILDYKTYTQIHNHTWINKITILDLFWDKSQIIKYQ